MNSPGSLTNPLPLTPPSTPHPPRPSLACYAPWKRLWSRVSPPHNPHRPPYPPATPCTPPPRYPQAISRMLRALDETVITGVPTTGPFHKLILNHPAFRSGDVDTGFIPKYQADLTTPPPTSKVSKSGAEGRQGG